MIDSKSAEGIQSQELEQLYSDYARDLTVFKAEQNKLYQEDLQRPPEQRVYVLTKDEFFTVDEGSREGIMNKIKRANIEYVRSAAGKHVVDINKHRQR